VVAASHKASSLIETKAGGPRDAVSLDFLCCGKTPAGHAKTADLSRIAYDEFCVACAQSTVVDMLCSSIWVVAIFVRDVDAAKTAR
jgi:hypothetical protein